MSPRAPFTAADLAQFIQLGIPVEHVEEQLEALRQPPAPVELVRACRLGDGIQRLPTAEHEDLLAHWREAATAGRLMKFVPASGAATRMFAALRWWRGRPDLASLADLRREATAEPLAAQALALAEGWDLLPFGAALTAPTSREWVRAVGRLLDERGWSEAPKGLVPFHRAAGVVRTAFEEHWVEAAGTLRAPGHDVCRLHFSVAPEHLSRFRAAADGIRSALEARLGARFDVTLSTQARATDTPAIGAEGEPVRQSDGQLLFQPSGHGALLPNLAAVEGDLVVIKNIDNVVPEHRQGLVVHWQRLLIGALSRLQGLVVGHLARLASERPSQPEIAAAVAFIGHELGIEAPLAGREGGEASLADWARERLGRPLRVCGMVPASGEPGGGPFWVRDAAGRVSPQIVEGAQLAADDAAQRAVWASATHFNPVDLACGLRDPRGRSYDLERWVDPATGFVAAKQWNAAPIRTLERPGLWNGAMAGWNTVFVEIPAATFAPVKTALDLLRSEHQAG